MFRKNNDDNVNQSDKNRQEDVKPTAPKLSSYPPYERWDDWVEYDSKSWPKKVERRYSLVPTTCFNCEAACGLLAYVDKESGEIRKLEGNPLHPISRGKSCARGQAGLNALYNPDRIRTPLRRKGSRGQQAEFEEISWDDAISDLASRLREIKAQNRAASVVYASADAKGVVRDQLEPAIDAASLARRRLAQRRFLVGGLDGLVLGPRRGHGRAARCRK